MSLHYVALGDSTTVGVGDPLNGSTTDLAGAGDLTPWAARMAVSQLRPTVNAEVQRIQA